MLIADKQNLETNLKVQLLRIRDRELSFYTNNCLAISTSASLLAGFAWNGITTDEINGDRHVIMQTLYLDITTLIMGLELLTVVNATMCAILGPGLALRGPDGSMHGAVNGMLVQYRFTFGCFALGLVGFLLSALIFVWTVFEPTIAAVLTVVLCYFMRLMYKYGRRIMTKFRLPEEKIVSGGFTVDALNAKLVTQVKSVKEIQSSFWEQNIALIRYGYQRSMNSGRGAAKKLDKLPRNLIRPLA